MPELAQSTEILVDDDGFGAILIDDEEFPFHVRNSDIEVEPLPSPDGEWHVLRLGVVVKGPVTVNGDLVDTWEAY